MLGFDLSVCLFEQQLFKVNILYSLLFSKYVYLCHVSWIEVFFLKLCIYVDLILNGLLNMLSLHIVSYSQCGLYL